MPAKKTDENRAPARKPAAKAPTPKAAAAKKASPRKAAAAKAETPAKTTKKTTTPAVVQRPAPARVPGRKERRGVVVSDAMDKTIVVRIDVTQKHDVYGRVVRRSSKLHVHDEHNTAAIGDLVRVVETRPLSATKRWRLLEVLERAK